MTLIPPEIRPATPADAPAIAALIQRSVRVLQPEYTPAQREAALRTVFTVDTRLLADGTYLVAIISGQIAACGGWSFRRLLFGGDHHHGHSKESGRLDPATDAAKIRAIFVDPGFARQGLGSRILQTAEQAAIAAGFRRFEMGSTLAGVPLYRLKGYREQDRLAVPVGDGESITVVRMEKVLDHTQ